MRTIQNGRSAYVAKLSCAIYVKPNGRDADGSRTAGLRRYSGHFRVRRRAVPPRLRHQHVLHVADERGEPQSLQGERGRVSETLQADAGADRGHPQARLQSHARTRRQHLFHRQARRHRWPFIPASRRRDDGLDPAGLCRDDAARRPAGRWQPLALLHRCAAEVPLGRAGEETRRGQGTRKDKVRGAIEVENPIEISKTEVTPWPGSLQVSVHLTCPPSGRRSTTARPRSRIGSGSSRASRNPRNGCGRPTRMSPSSSITITPPLFPWISFRPSRSVAPPNSRRPTRAGGRGRCRLSRAIPRSLRTSPSPSFWTNSTLPSATRWRSTTA